MMKLTGSEKQIKWAEDIRAWYEEKSSELKEIEIILRNTEKEGKRYTHKLTSQQETIIEIVAQQISNMRKYEVDKWTDARYEELEGTPSRIRIAEADFVLKIREELENKLDTEESAKFWIDIRL